MGLSDVASNPDNWRQVAIQFTANDAVVVLPAVTGRRYYIGTFSLGSDMSNSMTITRLVISAGSTLFVGRANSSSNSMLFEPPLVGDSGSGVTVTISELDANEEIDFTLTALLV
jgi:hypothetical protein